jgi:hypothetical protein
MATNLLRVWFSEKRKRAHEAVVMRSRPFTGTPVEDAFASMGSAISIEAMERVLNIKLNSLGRVPYTMLELKRASQCGARLVPSVCTVGHLQRTAPGMVRVDSRLQPSLLRWLYQPGWNLVSLRDGIDAQVSSSLDVRREVPPLPVYATALYLELMLNPDGALCKAPRVLDEHLEENKVLLLSINVMGGCPVLGVKAVPTQSPIPQALSWKRLPMSGGV